MKIALIHDGIICRGGAERVFLDFIKAFPSADIYSSVYYPEHSFPEFKNYKIKTSWYNKITKNEYSYRKFYFPFGFCAAKSLDLTSYDVILQSTTTGAKYAKFNTNALIISYCHQPFRLLWNPESYDLYNNARGIKKMLLKGLVNFYKRHDYKYANRVNIFIANSSATELSIKKAYNRNSNYVLNPPVGNLASKRNNYLAKDYYLVVSRLEPYKKVDLAIEAFNRIGKKLIIVGSGTQKSILLKMAKSNIEFKEGLSDSELSMLYAQCKALIFPQLEDYGITPIEAIASGRPVIAYGKGGVLETMIPYNGDNADECTAIFFDEQNPESLINACNQFEITKFNKNFIIEHSKKFSEQSFINNLQNIVNNEYVNHIERSDNLNNSKT